MIDPVFDIAVAAVLQHEGGYVNIDGDPGGETKYGISKRSYPDLDIANLTSERAKEIYRTDFWINTRIYRLPAVTTPAKVFDTAVWRGPVPAVRTLQQAICDLGRKVAIDGQIGDETITAGTFCDRVRLLQRYRQLLVQEIEAHLAAHPELEKFRAGWIKRANS